MMKPPANYEEIESLQQVANRGDIAVRFVSDGFWYGRCADDGCRNLHILLHEEDYPYEVGAAFTCEQLEAMLNTARMIVQRRGN